MIFLPPPPSLCIVEYFMWVILCYCCCYCCFLCFIYDWFTAGSLIMDCLVSLYGFIVPFSVGMKAERSFACLHITRFINFFHFYCACFCMCHFELFGCWIITVRSVSCLLVFLHCHWSYNHVYCTIVFSYFSTFVWMYCIVTSFGTISMKRVEAKLSQSQ